MNSPTIIWGNVVTSCEELLKIETNKLGLCRLAYPGAYTNCYEMRGFITDYDKQIYHYSPSYSCIQNRMPDKIFTSEDHNIRLEEFKTYKDTINSYENEIENGRIKRIDVDLKILYKVKTKTEKDIDKVVSKLSDYIGSLSINTYPQIIYTYCVLTMNMHIFNNLPGIPNNENKVKLDPEVYKKEIEEMKLYLKEQLRIKL